MYVAYTVYIGYINCQTIVYMYIHTHTALCYSTLTVSLFLYLSTSSTEANTSTFIELGNKDNPCYALD